MANWLLNEKVNDFYSVPDQIQGFKINRAGYGMVPKLVMLDKRLHVTAKAIYAYFCSYTGAGDTCFPSRKKICNDLDISIESFTKYSKQLVDVGYVEKKQIKEKGRFSHNLYTLLDEVPPCTEKTSQVLEKAGKICTSTVYGFSVYGKTDTKINSNIKINKLNKKERKEEERPQLFSEKINLKNEETKNEENIFEPKKVSKKENEKSFNVLIEEFSQNEVLCFELKEHLKIRKLKKAPLTNHALELSFKRLDSLSNSDDEKIAIVQKSIENGWTGFFPLKPFEKTQIRFSAVSQNTSYNIDEYLKTMDTFAITPEEKKELERKRNDEIKKQEFYKSFTIGDTPEDQRELTPEEIEEEERDTKEFIKKINDSVGFTNEDIAAALEEQKRMENERRENCFWF